MITNNFKNLCAMILEMTGINMGILPVVDVYGRTMYIACGISTTFPYVVYDDRVATTDYGEGITIGSGNRAESDTDYALQTPIYSDFSAVVSKSFGLDSGNPYIEYSIEIENTGSSSMTINEIGYIQQIRVLPSQLIAVPVNLYVSTTLLDRTVLSTPVTIAAGETGTVVYRLKTTISSDS